MELRQINKQEFLQELQKRIQDKQLTEQEVATIFRSGTMKKGLSISGCRPRTPKRNSRMG